jgi:hypothetical protein
LAILHESDLGVAEALLDELSAVGSDIEGIVGKISAEVDLFEIDQALALITSLRTRLQEKT